MTKKEAVEKLQQESKLLCHGCMHPQEMGWCKNHCKLPEAFNMAIEALQEQTTLDVAKGHWIIFPPFIEEICMCSNCKTKFKEAYQHRDTCPNCGAKMGEKE